MTKQYKDYVIDVSSSEERGRWWAAAKITGTLSGTQRKGFAFLISGRFKTQAEAEAEVFMLLKQRIDESTSQTH